MSGDLSKEAKMQAAFSAWPALVLFSIIVGGIYGGVFTATEAAAISVSITLVIGFLQKTLTMRTLWSAMKDTCLQTSAIFFIAAGAKIFVAFIALTGVTVSVVDMISTAQLPFWMLLLAIIVLYLGLGMFLDPIGILVLTLPWSFHWLIIMASISSGSVLLSSSCSKSA